MTNTEKPTPSHEAALARIEALEHLLNHIHREVATFQDFDAGSLMEEIEQTLDRTKVFDDNKFLHARIAELEWINDSLRTQAQCWASEAKMQRSIVHKVNQICSGATGEKADWNGANPVREKIAELEAKTHTVVSSSTDNKFTLNISGESMISRSKDGHWSGPWFDEIKDKILKEAKSTIQMSEELLENAVDSAMQELVKHPVQSVREGVRIALEIALISSGQVERIA